MSRKRRIDKDCSCFGTLDEGFSLAVRELHRNQLQGGMMETLLYTVLENWSLIVSIVAAYYILSVLRINRVIG
jgi:hypothetical protein